MTDLARPLGLFRGRILTYRKQIRSLRGLGDSPFGHMDIASFF